jgi:hypothetical protein
VQVLRLQSGLRRGSAGIVADGGEVREKSGSSGGKGMARSAGRQVTEKKPADHAERDAIRTHLDVTMMVEAAAGTGKTTSLVGRMVNLVRGGRASTATIAAITFTVKAAAQLRQRFQEEIEKSIAAEREAEDRNAEDRNAKQVERRPLRPPTARRRAERRPKHNVRKTRKPASFRASARNLAGRARRSAVKGVVTPTNPAPRYYAPGPPGLSSPFPTSTRFSASAAAIPSRSTRMSSRNLLKKFM